jgi:hypothetical protein
LPPAFAARLRGVVLADAFGAERRVVELELRALRELLARALEPLLRELDFRAPDPEPARELELREAAPPPPARLPAPRELVREPPDPDDDLREDDRPEDDRPPLPPLDSAIAFLL